LVIHDYERATAFAEVEQEARRRAVLRPELDRLTRRLIAANPDVDPDVIRDAVELCAVRWARATVTDFVPLLAERHCRHVLAVARRNP
jgi:hypothetical protein